MMFVLNEVKINLFLFVCLVQLFLSILFMNIIMNTNDTRTISNQLPTLKWKAAVTDGILTKQLKEGVVLL